MPKPTPDLLGDILGQPTGRPPSPPPGQPASQLASQPPEQPPSEPVDQPAAELPGLDELLSLYKRSAKQKPALSLQTDLLEQVDALVAELEAAAPAHRRREISRSLVVNYLLRLALERVGE